jgi:sterol desaturase/sphingolipid hydroxylase (fatty acid hydroxylase superfamily)
MFQRDWVDFFSRTHWAAVPILFLPGAAVPFVHGLEVAHVGVAVSIVVFFLGVVAWTLSEYWLHRSFFHWQPAGRWGERLHFWVHGVHHRWPNDRFRLVMPPAVGIFLYVLCLGLFHGLLGPRWSWPFFSGYVFGYVFYDVTHYYLHHGKPRSGYWRRLRRHHLLHHFKDDRSRFAVSNDLWDRVFGSEGSPLPAGRTPNTAEVGPR